jgi:predicted porin
MLAILPFCLGSAARAQSDTVQMYGRLNLGLESAHASGQAGHSAPAASRLTRLANYRSVIGLRGNAPLGEGLHLIWQVEGAVAPDTGTGALASRNTRVGLEGRWGTLFAGNWTTPYNASTADLDPFYVTTAGYMSIMGNGAAPSSDNLSDITSFDRRQQNSLHYWTPSWRGLSLRLAHGFSEERPAGGARPALDSAALQLERGPLYVALAHERHRDYHGPGRDDRGTRLALAYRFGPTRLALVGERLDYRTGSGALRRDAWYVSATRQVGRHALSLGVAKAQDGKGDATERIGFISAGPDTGAVHATIGYELALSRRTTLFAFHTRLHNDDRGAVDFAINGLDPFAGAHLRGTALGIRHAF